MKHIIFLLSFITVLGRVDLCAQESRNGYWFPPMDTLRILVVYAELQNDPDDPGVIRGWKAGTLPPGPEIMFDHQLLPGDKPEGYITRYYHQASFGKYVVLGDYYPEIVSINFKDVRGNGVEQVLHIIAENDDDDIITSHGYSVNNGDFDFITTSRKGEPKNIESDSLIDIVMVIWRVNSRITTDLSAGFCSTRTKIMRIKAMKGMNSYSSFVNKDYKRPSIIRHEFSHLLLGGNNFHTGGAGAGTKTFMSDVGGFAMLSSNLRSSPVYCSFDRRRLGWIHPGHKYQISAKDPQTGEELNTDLNYRQNFPNGSGEFLLGDFVSAGDAIRIELPYLNLYSEKINRQWLWLENHQKEEGNIDHDKSSRAGLYAYIQVGKESLSGNGTFGGIGNYTWPVSAFGNYDFIIDEKTSVLEARDELENPFTGYNNLIFGAYDLKDRDGMIYRNELFLAKNLILNGEYPDRSMFNFETYPMYGTAWDAFLPGYKIAIDRNPAALPVLTYQTSSSTRARPGNPVSTDNRDIHLNGISVEFMEQLADGSIRVRIKWDDNVVGRNSRWCGSIHLHEPIQLSKGVRVLIDQGLTPQKPINPVEIAGQNVFADSTSFFIHPGAGIRMGRKSQIILDNKSSLILEKGSTISMARGARILVRDSGKLYINPEAEISGRGKIILENGSSFISDDNFPDVKIKFSSRQP